MAPHTLPAAVNPQPRSLGHMRALKYTLLIALIALAGVYVASFSGAPILYAQAVTPRATTAAAAATPSPAAAPLPPPELSKQEKQRKAIDEFFQGPIRKINIEIAPDQVERLKRDERNYVEATVKEGDTTHKSVGLKLKGSAGSFQGFDGKPGITLNFDKFKGAKRFHGMKRLHLNNAAQDGTYLNEAIAGEIARKGGVPASRCTHALVQLNGRDVGLYVVKESFTKEFLSAFYSDPTGDLYDGGFVKDIAEDSEKDEGDPTEKTALKELIAACQEGDNAKRWERLGKILDLPQFISYMAMENILAHWDGYSFNRNNYRFYKDPGTGKFTFILHGLDQAFQDPGFAVLRDPGAMVSSAVMRCPEAKPIYLERMEHFNTTVLTTTDWGARVTELGEKVRAALAAKDPPKSDQLAKDYEGQIKVARERVTRRIEEVGKQLAAIPKPVVFGENGVMKLGKDWRQEGGGAHLAMAEVDGQPCLHIRANGQSSASWRKTVQLPAGKYRFSAQVRTAGVSPEGAGLRISGGPRNEDATAKGDTPWKKVEFTFDSGGGDVVLVADLRGDKGEVWYQQESLQLTQVK
jgi:spore coat protein H